MNSRISRGFRTAIAIALIVAGLSAALIGCKASANVAAQPIASSAPAPRPAPHITSQEAKSTPAVQVVRTARKPAPFDSPPRDVDFGRMSLEIAFSPEDLKAKAMAGLVTHHIRPRRDGLTNVSLNAMGMKIFQVEAGTERRSAQFAHDGTTLNVTLPEATRKGHELELRITYRVESPPLGLHFVDDPSDETFTIYSNGEPLQARYWLPCHDWPDARWTGCDVRICVPTGLTAVSVGNPTGPLTTSADGSLTTFSWRLDVPIDPHLLGFSIGKYKEYTVESPGTPVSFFTQPEYEAEAREAFADAPEALQYFSALTGVDYPFPRFAHVVVPRHFHGGMEHAGFNMIAPRMFEGNPRGDWVRFAYLAHMIAHQWFAGLVNYRHITEAWVNEGFGSYLHMLWLHEKRGEEAFRADLRRTRDIVLRFDIGGKSHPIVNTEIAKPEDIYGFGGGLVYWKGAWVLHMLRGELGDEVFWRGVRGYLNAHRFGDVDTHDLKAAFELAARRDLTDYFKQWVWRDGTPRVKGQWTWNAADAMLAIDFEQNQLIDDSHPPFRFPLMLEIETTGAPVRHQVQVTGATHRFTFSANEKPKRVIGDPDFHLLASVSISEAGTESQPTSSPGEHITGSNQ